jgi:Tetratricopeptide repeat
MYREELEVRERVLGKEHLDILTSIGNLALMLSDQGKYNEAEQIYQKELEVRERVLGKKYPFILISIDNLVGMLRN